jgi:SRSO17 transposase
MLQWAGGGSAMTQRLACPPAPGPLEDYAAQFDDRFETLAQRRGFRAYLQGLLLPRDRNKTLTALIGTEPIVGAQHPDVQRLQFFLSESTWDAEAINARRLELLLADPPTAPHDGGALVIDETGDRKDGTKTAHVARQYLGSRGKIENGIVAVTSLWADERVYYPLDVRPYTPAGRLPKGKADPAFRTKPRLAVELVDLALERGISFRAVVADCLYGENADFAGALEEAGLPYVLGVKPSTGIWAPTDAVHSPAEAVRELRWESAEEPGDWTPIVREFRDGHTETWWAVELAYGPYGPDQRRRMIVATTDPATLPDQSTWYLTTNLPHPTRADLAEIPFAPADLAEVVRLYALRNWVEQSYRQVKHELGWADFQVRADPAIRRHWQLVCCAFAFCWRHWFSGVADLAPAQDADPTVPDPPAAPAEESAGRGENRRAAVLAQGAAPRPRLAGSVDLPATLLAGVVRSAPAGGAPSAPRLARRRTPAQSVPA